MIIVHIDSCFSNADDLNYSDDQGWDIKEALDVEECKHSEAFSNMPAQIKKCKYGTVSASKVSTEQKHMTASKKKKLENLLKEFGVIFDGKLGHYPHK